MIKKIILINLIIFLFVSCNKDSDNNDNSENPNINTADYLFVISGKLNGVPFVYGFKNGDTDTDYMSYNGFSGSCNNENESISGRNYSTGVSPNLDDNLPSISFDFIRFYICSLSVQEYEVFNDLFPVSSYELALSEDPHYTGTTGAVGVNYENPQIGYYRSYEGDQTGSTFEITSSEENNQYLFGVLVEVSQNIEGKFSAKVYNTEDSSDVIDITEGVFKLNIRLLL